MATKKPASKSAKPKTPPSARPKPPRKRRPPAVVIPVARVILPNDREGDGEIARQIVRRLHAEDRAIVLTVLMTMFGVGRSGVSTAEATRLLRTITLTHRKAFDAAMAHFAKHRDLRAAAEVLVQKFHECGGVHLVSMYERDEVLGGEATAPPSRKRRTERAPAAVPPRRVPTTTKKRSPRKR